MTRTAAALTGAAGALAASLVVSAALDRESREDLAEAVATVVAAPAVAVLYPFRQWGARTVPPEGFAALIRAHFLDDESPALRFWSFALTRRTGLVWLHEVPRNGRRWRAGRTADFRAPIRVAVRDLDPEETDR